MTGIAALLNPNAPSSRNIQVFYNTNSLNLGLLLQSSDVTDEVGSRSFSPSDNSHEGLIYKESSLAAAPYLDTQFIVGLTNQKPKDKGTPAPKDDGTTTPTTLDISIVSPLYMPLTTVDSENTSLAFCSDGERGSIFYLGGDIVEKPSIFEYYLNDNTATEMPIDGVAKGSALCAYYAGDRRHCIFEGRHGVLMEFDGDQSAPAIPGSGAAVNHTPLGLSYSPREEKVALYFCDKNRALNRMLKVQGKWGNVVQVGNANPVAAESQLTVVTTEKTNHIFYVTGTKGEIYHARDQV